MSKHIVNMHRRNYKFRLPVAKRCVWCRHINIDAQPGVVNPLPSGECRLLDIAVANVSTSACPGFESNVRTVTA